MGAPTFWTIVVAVAAACSPAQDETRVYVDVHGAVDAVRRVQVRLALEAGGEAEHETTLLAASADGIWRADLGSVGGGAYASSAAALDADGRVLQTAASPGPIHVGSGDNRFDLPLSPVDCEALGCGRLGAACVVGLCDAIAGRCEAVAEDDGSACDDGDACTSPDACAAGACRGSPIDEDGDGVAVERCAPRPALGDCDDGDFRSAPGAPSEGGLGGARDLDLPPSAAEDDWTEIPLVLEARLPVVVSRATRGNVVESLDFVPGSLLLGEVCRRLARVLRAADRHDLWQAVARGELVVGPFLPLADGRTTQPVPLSFAAPKGTSGLDGAGAAGVVNLLCEPAPAGKQLQSER